MPKIKAKLLRALKIQGRQYRSGDTVEVEHEHAFALVRGGAAETSSPVPFPTGLGAGYATVGRAIETTTVGRVAPPFRTTTSDPWGGGYTRRRAAEPLPMIVGYAARFGELSTDFYLDKDGRSYREKIRAGAFAALLRNNPSVRATIDHDIFRTIAKSGSGSGSLRLWEDSVGLRFEIDPAPDAAGLGTVDRVRKKALAFASFRFIPRVVAWRSEAGQLVREIQVVDSLLDVALVTRPAYRSTTVGLQKRGTSGRAADCLARLLAAEATL